MADLTQQLASAFLKPINTERGLEEAKLQASLIAALKLQGRNEKETQ